MKKKLEPIVLDCCCNRCGSDELSKKEQTKNMPAHIHCNYCGHDMLPKVRVHTSPVYCGNCKYFKGFDYVTSYDIFRCHDCFKKIDVERSSEHSYTERVDHPVYEIDSTTGKRYRSREYLIGYRDGHRYGVINADHDCPYYKRKWWKFWV